jgi:membrane associated rhomboid family serine protease
VGAEYVCSALTGPCYAAHVAQSRSTRPSLRGAPFTASFITICALVFVAGLVSPSAQRQIFLRFSQINAAVAAGEWWRLLTSAFLHAGLAHIAFNMWALLLFGPPLERQLGAATFGTTCLACAAWGGAAAYVLTGPRSILVGASGAIFGVFGIWLYASYLSRETPMGQAQFRNLMTLLAINAFLSFAVPRISWQGHAGGLASGIAIAAAWRRLPRPSTPARRTLVAAAALATAIAVVLVPPR